MNLLTHDSGRASRLVRDIRSEWLQGAVPDAQQALQQYPDLLEDRSAVVELAYEEFCLRRQAGEEIDLEAFCARFPHIQSYLLRVLSADQMLAGHASLVRQPIAAPCDWPVAGDTWGQCLILRELGRGTFARVYLALERSAGDRPVALKLSRAGSREAHTLGRLHHEYVVPIHWASQDPFSGLTVVCMPFLGSATFADILDRLYPHPGTRPPQSARALENALREIGQPEDPQPDVLLAGPRITGLPFVEAVSQLGQTLAEALTFLHARGLYHCDLKPSNLLLTPGGRPLLLDFNLARAEGRSGGLFGGTFVYMAPEQLQMHLLRKEHSLDQAAAADLFSLGVILYELLTGRLPFGQPPTGLSPEGLASWLLERMAFGHLPVQRLNPEVPPALAELLDRCLSPDPKKRPSALELARCLGPKRRATSLTWIAAGLVGAALIAGLSLLPAAPSPRPRTEVTAPRTEPSPQEEMARLREAGMQALEKASKLIPTVQRQEAAPLLREAGLALRKLLELHELEPQPLVGAWKDYLAQAHTAILLDSPAEGRTLAERADRLYRTDVARLAVGCVLGSSGSVPLGGTSLLWAIPVLGKHPSILATRAYCQARLGAHAESLQFGQEALAQGLRSVALLNNLSYSARQTKQLDLARDYLDEALCKAPDCYQAILNSCQVAYRLSLANREPIPDWVLQQVQHGLELLQHQRAPQTTELYRNITEIYARAILDTKQQLASLPEQVHRTRLEQELLRRQQHAREYLERGCRLGLNPAHLLREPLLKQALGDWLQPERLESIRQQVPSVAVSNYLIDPLSDVR